MKDALITIDGSILNEMNTLSVSMTVSWRQGLGVHGPNLPKINPAYHHDNRELFASVTYITSAGVGGDNIVTQEKPS